MALTFSQLRLMASTWSLLHPDSLVRAETLLSVEQVPDVLKEPYIFTGYRPLGRPWKYYFCSILLLHNESVNIWSHTIGFFVVLLRLAHFFSDVDVLQDKVAWPVLGFGVSCLLSLTLSAAAHLLHSRSRWHHFLFFLMDYMGVTFYSFGTGIISMFTCSSRGYHDALHGWFLPANVFFSWFSFYACCIAKTHLSHDNTKRKSLMLAAVALQGIFVAMPVITRYVECLLSPVCELQSLNHISLALFGLSLCAMTFAGHCPESWLPGWFDILGHGHQIFHILTVIVMLLEVRIIDIEVNIIGTARDFEPDLIHICLAFVTLFVLEAATLVYHVHFIFLQRLSLEIPRRDVQESLVSKDETEAQGTGSQISKDVTDAQGTGSQISKDETEAQGTGSQISKEETEAWLTESIENDAAAIKKCN